MVETKEIYTVAEACEILRTSRQTLDTWRKKKIIKSVKIGGKIFIKRSELLRVLKEN